MNSELAESYRCAETVARSRARNFYYSFVVLPPEKRRAFCAVYAFMRYCDDISDGASSLDQKREMLRRWRATLNEVAGGDLHSHPILPAFHDSLGRFAIPAQYFHWIIDGAEMDLEIDHYSTFQQLYRYCFNVASAVGLVCLQIFGYGDEGAKEHAEHCGIAFQLTNILRDVQEDAAMGRVYLPFEDLERFGYRPEELKRAVLDDRFRKLMSFESERASGYYAKGRRLIPMIEPSSRPALWAMMEIYGRILKKIVRRQYDVFGNRVCLSAPEKASIALRALVMRYIPPRH